MPPGYVGSLEDYWIWVERLVHDSGGWLEDDVLLARPLEDSVNPRDWRGLVIERQRVVFADQSFLQIHLVVDEDFELVEYHFHYQDSEGWLIWRKDKHPGHEEEVGGLSHIHRDPKELNQVEPFEEVELDEVFRQVQERLASMPAGPFA